MNALPDNLGVPQAVPKFVMFANYFACNQCAEPNAEPFQWCEHIKNQISRSADATFFHPGMTVNVPIMPDAGIWAEVHIDNDVFPGGIARMEMYYKPDFGNLRKIDIGLWNPGEGLWVMRTCIIDYIRSKLDPSEEVTNLAPIKTPCPARMTHNLPAKRWMAGCHTDMNKKWKCLWNIVMEDACTFCVQLGNDPSNSGMNTL